MPIIPTSSIGHRCDRLAANVRHRVSTSATCLRRTSSIARTRPFSCLNRVHPRSPPHSHASPLRATPWNRNNIYSSISTRIVSLSTTTARAFAATDVSQSSPSQIQPIKDESHPSLYFHVFESENEHERPVFALSFSGKRPLTRQSKSVLGWLPAVSEAGEGESGLNDFKENSEFVALLHQCIRDNLLDDDIWRNYAIQTQSGWMHIFDQRSPPPLGRIPDPDDIIGTVRVEEGQMLIDTYSPLPTYRLCTGEGVCQLTDVLTERLKTMSQEEGN